MAAFLIGIATVLGVILVTILALLIPGRQDDKHKKPQGRGHKTGRRSKPALPKRSRDIVTELERLKRERTDLHEKLNSLQQAIRTYRILQNQLEELGKLIGDRRKFESQLKILKQEIGSLTNELEVLENDQARDSRQINGIKSYFGKRLDEQHKTARSLQAKIATLDLKIANLAERVSS